MSILVSQSGGVLIVGPKENFLSKVAAFLGKKDLKLTNNPDLLILDEPKTGIETVRELKSFFSQKKWTQKEERMVLINFGEGLSSEAQNAILKTLEELKTGNYIFISVPSQETLLPTIVSRCQVIHSAKKEAKSSKPSLDLEKLSGLSVAERLARASSKNFGKEEIKEIINYYQKQLSKKGNLKTIKKWLAACLQSQKMLEANIRPETVLDWLLLNL